MTQPSEADRSFISDCDSDEPSIETSRNRRSSVGQRIISHNFLNDSRATQLSQQDALISYVRHTLSPFRSTRRNLSYQRNHHIRSILNESERRRTTQRDTMELLERNVNTLLQELQSIRNGFNQTETKKQRGLTKEQINKIKTSEYEDSESEKPQIPRIKSRNGIHKDRTSCRLNKTSPSKKSLSTSSKTCAICLEDYKKKDILRNLQCLHDFHQSCIDEWLRNKTTCPICKKDPISVPEINTEDRLVIEDESMTSEAIIDNRSTIPLPSNRGNSTMGLTLPSFFLLVPETMRIQRNESNNTN